MVTHTPRRHSENFKHKSPSFPSRSYYLFLSISHHIFGSLHIHMPCFFTKPVYEICLPNYLNGLNGWWFWKHHRNCITLSACVVCGLKSPAMYPLIEAWNRAKQANTCRFSLQTAKKVSVPKKENSIFQFLLPSIANDS